MSQIKLKHSGGNSVIIAAPSSNPSSDVTFRLPNADGSANEFLKTDGSGNLSFGAAGGAITMADQYRLTSDTACNNAVITLTTNLERTDTLGQGHLGTGMSESSGLFTFPSTGIYKIDFQFNAYSTSDIRYVGGRVLITTDNNSSSEILADSSDGIANVSGSSSWGTSAASSLVDITNTSTHKVKFQIYSSGNVTFRGNTDQNWNYMTFIRLGDT
tara:strand:- start:249 stop:893 length:645 start_codon:yes stop_codon:yes gene_type:complete